jgi:hypothetical protein
MIISKPYQVESKIFTEAAELPAMLKNPNQFKEAVIFEHMSHMSPGRIKSFVRSTEAKTMVEAGTITYDTLDRLSRRADAETDGLNTAVCHIAKEDGDELWDELVKTRAEERRIMNELLAKYREEALPVATNAREEIIEKCIPAQYREG